MPFWRRRRDEDATPEPDTPDSTRDGPDGWEPDPPTSALPSRWSGTGRGARTAPPRTGRDLSTAGARRRSGRRGCRRSRRDGLRAPRRRRARSRGGFMARLRGILGRRGRRGDLGGGRGDAHRRGRRGRARDRGGRARPAPPRPGRPRGAVRAELAALLAPREPGWGFEPAVAGQPAVILVVGVNGTGKTTTIGKIADPRTRPRAARVLLAAARHVPRGRDRPAPDLGRAGRRPRRRPRPGRRPGGGRLRRPRRGGRPRRGPASSPTRPAGCTRSRT